MSFWLLHAIGILLYISVISAGDLIQMECTGCKGNLKNGKIVVADGKDVQLKFIIEKRAYSITNIYRGGNTTVVLVDATRAGKKTYNNFTRFDLGGQTVTSDSTHYWFNITFKKVDLMMDNNKVFLNYLVVGETLVDKRSGELTLDVQKEPTIPAGIPWKDTHTVSEGKQENVTFITLLGNPAPTVTAMIGNENLTVIQSEVTKYKYQYVIPLRLTRSQCGKNVTLNAVGYKVKSYTTKIIVEFMPNAVEVVSAKVQLDNCLDASWKPVDSGDCSVVYKITYKNNGTELGPWKVSDKFNIHKCLKDVGATATENDILIVSAMHGVNGTNGTSVNVTVLQKPLTEPRVGSTAAPTLKPNSKSLEWYYILIIVLACVLLLLIVLCIVLVCAGKICKRTKDGKKSKTAPSPSSDGHHNPRFEGGVELQVQSEHDYAPVDDFVRTQETTKKPQQTDYAELGPGGRMGERPVLPEQSLYAEVNPDAGYYPQLYSQRAGRPGGRGDLPQEPPMEVLYATSTKQRAKPTTQLPVYAVSSKARTPRPPSSNYDDDDDAADSITV